ncbi:hypothetical protein AQJ27_38135 [Streptomyces olivochromogenes]|nr:hypothetical protein AQJ27_38135 [Streptomyces olivochromogenes]
MGGGFGQGLGDVLGLSSVAVGCGDQFPGDVVGDGCTEVFAGEAWHDGTVNFTREDDVKANFAQIRAGQFDPQDMIDRMVSAIGAYRNVWPPAIEDLVKQAQEGAWTRKN